MTREELEEQRAFLLASLDDLDGEWEAGDIEAADYEALKADYTARLAAVLRTIDRLDGKAKEARRPAAASRPAATRRRWPLVVSAVVTVVVALGAGVLVTRTSGERLPGEAVTGETPPGNDVSALIQRAVAAEGQGPTVALDLYDQALAKDPENVIALSQKGWLLARTGRQLADAPDLADSSERYLAAAQEALDKAVAVDPTYADAHFFRGLVLTFRGRPAEGVCDLRLFLSIAPPNTPRRGDVEALLEEATKRAGGTVQCGPSPVQPGPGLPGAPTTTTTGAPTP